MQTNSSTIYIYIYVDDGLYVSNNNNTNADNILKQLNNIHPKIQSTEEKEKHKKINYLDITITRYNKQYTENQLPLTSLYLTILTTHHNIK